MNAASLARIAASLALCFGTGHAQAVDLTLKLMDFDVAQPTREQYRDSELGDTLINKAIAQAWQAVASGRVTDEIRKWLQQPDRLGSGMTARDIQIRLGQPGLPQLVSTAQASGRMTLAVPGNEIDLTTTHPISRGPSMDPRVRIRFDLLLTVDLHLDPQKPRLRAIEAIAQPGNVALFPLNHWASVGAALDHVLSGFGGKPTLTQKVSTALVQTRMPFTNTFNNEMTRNQPALVLPGFTYNGGRIENNRVIIAQYRLAPAETAARVAVVASWPKSLGELMSDCGPVAIGANWQAAPRPFAGVREPARHTGKVTNVNPRTVRRDEYICSTVIQVAKGAPLEITWAKPVPVNVGSPNPMAMRQVLAAKPAGWNNPVVPNEIEYVLALAKETRPGIGVQSDAIAAAKRNPLDPVAQERRVDQVTLPATRSQPTVEANPAMKALPAPAGSLATTRAPAEQTSSLPAAVTNPAATNAAATNPVATANPAAVTTQPAPAGSLATTRTQAGSTSAATTRLQTPQRTVVPPDSTFSR